MPPGSRWADWREPSPKPVDLVPLYPVVPFTPVAPCGHHGVIRDGSSWYCEQCGQVSRPNQRTIDVRSIGLPLPEDPEYKIARWQRMLDRGLLTDDEQVLMRERIGEMLRLIDPGNRPTRYMPNPRLRGGIGR